MKYLVVILLLLGGLSYGQSWVTAELAKSQQIAILGGFPVYKCFYKIGEASDFVFNININQAECPRVVFYNIETNKWSKEYP